MTTNAKVTDRGLDPSMDRLATRSGVTSSFRTRNYALAQIKNSFRSAGHVDNGKRQLQLAAEQNDNAITRMETELPVERRSLQDAQFGLG
ncbi:unnamed protein product [Protopolystoma xenopodis]|uniref:Uncharacterized protein n=1 Tax=Protopolystoma xenopodis TaxID=117903 RepID=A0A448WI35_9PLAT|nr:unnamed protein product [Protopolystoma xenopodis]